MSHIRDICDLLKGIEGIYLSLWRGGALNRRGAIELATAAEQPRGTGAAQQAKYFAYENSRRYRLKTQCEEPRFNLAKSHIIGMWPGRPCPSKRDLPQLRQEESSPQQP